MSDAMRAISIKQPYVELILRGRKVAEYRSVVTHIRGRVYLYASKNPAGDHEAWEDAGARPGSLPTGVILGTVEIVNCELDDEGGYAYVLANPQRLETPLRAVNHPQPCFWIPKFAQEQPVAQPECESSPVPAL